MKMDDETEEWELDRDVRSGKLSESFSGEKL
jgi:hypothetical protein